MSQGNIDHMTIPKQNELYQKQGFCGPLTFCSETQAKQWRSDFYNAIEQSEIDAKATNKNLSAFHHTYPWAYALCTQTFILDQISKILQSENIVLWAMHFWYKEPGSTTYIPWHQDRDYWPMKPAINATAWVALGECNEENGCLRLIPETHHKTFDHVELGAKAAFKKGITQIDDSKAQNMMMNPGQVVFFNESTVHGSNANTSKQARVACSIRYTLPSVKFIIDDWQGDKERIKTFLVKGEDTHHLNDDINGTVPLH